MAAMLTAAVVTAGVTSFAVLMVVVVAVNIGIVTQVIAEQGVHRCVSFSADTAVELDARFGQRCLRSAADAAADQRIHAVLHQKARQGTMAAAVGINDFRMNDFAVRSFIKLEPVSYTHLLPGMETLEPFNIIYQTAEDGLGDTVKPRLMEAEADLERVLVIDDRDTPLTLADERIARAIQMCIRDR